MRVYGMGYGKGRRGAEEACRELPRLRIARGEMESTPKGSMHGAKE